MIGALGATPTICLQQHDCVATLIGKASSENEGAGRGGVVPGASPARKPYARTYLLSSTRLSRVPMGGVDA